MGGGGWGADMGECPWGGGAREHQGVGLAGEGGVGGVGAPVGGEGRVLGARHGLADAEVQARGIHRTIRVVEMGNFLAKEGHRTGGGEG